MELHIDSALHIIDTETDFIITAKGINLSFKLGASERKKVYELLERVRNGQSISEEIQKQGTFEAKFLMLLYQKGVIYEKSTGHELGKLPFNKIYAPLSFLSIVRENLGLASEWREETDENGIDSEDFSCLHFFDEEVAERSVYVYVFENCFYLSVKNDWQKRVSTLSELHLEHAAYVFLDKLKKQELGGWEKHVLQIDLSIYNNDIQELAQQDIDEDRLLESVLINEQLTGNKIKLDFDQYFPLVFVEFQLRDGEKSFYSFGFDQRDALRNLLYILEQEGFGGRVKRSLEYKQEFELNKDTFLKKYMCIYFDQEELMLQHTNEGKIISCEGINYTLVNTQCCENSLFVSLYFNQKMGNKGAYIYGNEALRT